MNHLTGSSRANHKAGGRSDPYLAPDRVGRALPALPPRRLEVGGYADLGLIPEKPQVGTSAYRKRARLAWITLVVTILQLLVALRPATPTITAEQVEQIVERVTEQIKDDEEQQDEPESFAPVDPHSSAGWDRRPQ